MGGHATTTGGDTRWRKHLKNTIRRRNSGCTAATTRTATLGARDNEQRDGARDDGHAEDDDIGVAHDDEDDTGGTHYDNYIGGPSETTTTLGVGTRRQRGRQRRWGYTRRRALEWTHNDHDDDHDDIEWTHDDDIWATRLPRRWGHTTAHWRVARPRQLRGQTTMTLTHTNTHTHTHIHT